MKKNIFKGRYTAITKDSFVVFLVGMRVNQWWAAHKWWPVFKAMKNMLDDFNRNPDKGMLSAVIRFSWREISVTSYWKSYDQLENYARMPTSSHLQPWKNFNKAIGATGSVGIWHETYLIAERDYECVYVNMPVTGLAKAKITRFLKAEGVRETSRLRIGRGKNRPAVPTPK